jgi:predicted metal-binding membrane protein
VNESALEAVLRRDRRVVATALAAMILLAWAYVVWLASLMDMGGMDMSGYRMLPSGDALMLPALEPWSRIEFALVFAMWVVMMVGMMLPSAAPMVLIYARVGRQAATQGRPFAATGWFLAGYLSAWSGFSLLATLAQWALDRAALLDARMTTPSSMLGGSVLVAAGIYQWTALKDACLRQCQAPFAFIQKHGGFRGDARGALRLGLWHGSWCVGCCWPLMALLFVGGVMNVLWIAALAILVLAEKVLPAGRWIARVAGLALVLAGAWLLARATV